MTKVIDKEKFREYRKSGQVVGKEGKIERQAEPRNEQLELLKSLAQSMQAILSKPVPAPQITVRAPDVKVNIPETKLAKGWRFKAKKTNDTWDITAERVE